MTPFENSSYSITKTYYDKNSNVIKQAEANNSSLWQTKEYQYDSMGNVIADIAVGYNNDSNIVTQYNYDTAGRISGNGKGTEWLQRGYLPAEQSRIIHIIMRAIYR